VPQGTRGLYMSSRVPSDEILIVDKRCEVMVRSKERVRFETPPFDWLRFSPENSDQFTAIYTATLRSSSKPFSRDSVESSPHSRFKKFSLESRLNASDERYFSQIQTVSLERTRQQ